jgi:putative membrane-bound dehydrogenase-like protein
MVRRDPPPHYPKVPATWNGCEFGWPGFRRGSRFRDTIAMTTKFIRLCGLLFAGLLAVANQAADPLRVFIRAGIKTHGPGQHDHPRFLGEYTQLLGQRGVQVDGAMGLPTAAQLEKTDVVVVFAADGMKITGENRANFEKFLQRGGGLVVLHDGVVSGDQHEWAKQVMGGAWRWDGDKKTKWYEGEVGVYFVNTEHPVTRGISNFDWKDEIYYDLDMAPDVNVLATSFHSVFVIAPQIWTYEKTWPGGTKPYRSIVSLPGHEYVSFQSPHYKAMVLRSIAWAGRRDNVDEFCKPEELASLKYPEGGPVTPEKAAAKVITHPEFEVKVIASEPLLEKAISMDWDPSGKVWVAETPEYPGGRTINKNDRPIAPVFLKNPGQTPAGDKEDRPARDRISWLEDTNGDGVMDKKHVFADGLELVTSLVFHKDGVIVAQAPEILWLRDKNGDGVCDMVEGSEKITLFTGFGNFDTHAVINNFRWGMDGWVYGAVGYSAGSPKSLDGKKDFGRITAGVIRFRPDGSAIEQYAAGTCNTWGFDFAPDGEVFYTTATCGEHFLHVVMPEKALAKASVGGIRSSFVAPDHQKIFPAVKHTRPAYVQIDWVGYFTAAAGCCIYNGGAWPERYNGSHFTSETTMSLVHNELLTPKGVTYVASKEAGREETEFVASTDLWFRPVHERIGPDGALYIVDFYNQAAIHNDTRGPAHGARNAATRPDRDHHFGRIWKVQHKQAKTLPAWKFDSKNAAGLVALLDHPNGWVRMTAHRLLSEQPAEFSRAALSQAVAAGKPSLSRMHAMWVLNNVGALDQKDLVLALNDADPVLRKNALKVVAEASSGSRPASGPVGPAVQASIRSTEPRVQINALLAMASMEATPAIAAEIVALWPELKDKHLQSAALGVAANNPSMFVSAAFQAKDPAFLADFVGHAVRILANKGDASQVAQVISLLSKQPASADALKQSALETLAGALKADVVPAWNADLQAALGAMLKSTRPGLPGSVLPLVARWDKTGAMSDALKPVISQLRTSLADASLADDQRAQVAINLLGVRRLDTGIIPSVGALLGGNGSTGLQRRVIDALGVTPEPAVGEQLVSAFSRVSGELQEPLFGAVLKRGDWSMRMVQALADKTIGLQQVGPAFQHRLRTHADKAVAAKANETIDGLKGPEQKEKEALIARLVPEVEKVGNVENGKKLYTANCAGCHVFKNEGRNLAPNLTGMGAHGAADLLVHIVDPNRLVEPNFVAVSIETKDELTYNGVIDRENNAEVLIRDASGDNTIRKDNIKSRTNTGRSLMPEGFEQLGAEGLRDLLTYICADENRFRILDMTGVFNVANNKGIYANEEAKDETVRFRKHGTIKVGDVPFDVLSLQKSPTGNNLLVLKGTEGLARNYPAKVELKAGIAIGRLHFLGGVGGWAYPYNGENTKGLPVTKVTLHFAGGTTEEIMIRNGIEVADYIGRFDVPGSKEVPELAAGGKQVRAFTKLVKGRAVVEKITLESLNNFVAATWVGITAELPGNDGAMLAPLQAGGESAAAAPPAPKFEWGAGLKTLIVGGGSSHDFQRFFNLADVATLKATGKAAVNYTETTGGLAPVIKDLDILYLSNNKPFTDAATRDAVLNHARSGKGMLIVHPSLWYNWEGNWPEYNRELCGGGSRGHDRYGEFEVTVTEPNHPLMKGVPAKFTLADELYWFEPDTKGTEIQVLATAYSKQKNKTYPMVFVVKHPKSRIAAITLGHDGASHSHPAYQALLVNALDWASKK